MSRARAVRVRSFVLELCAQSSFVTRLDLESGVRRHTIVADDRRWRLRYETESAEHSSVPDPGGSITLLLGDDAEWTEVGDDRWMGNAAVVQLDLQQGTMEARTSITGLPPIFLSRRAGGFAIASDLTALTESGGSLRFDAEALEDVLEFGYPTGHRTLFADTALVPGGYLVRSTTHGGAVMTKGWSLPEAKKLNWPAYVEFQVAEFRSAMRRLDLSDSFLSLTGGVDTRTILAALVSTGCSTPAATLCGESLSLDARVARALSSTYDFPHDTVHLGAEFKRDLPAFVTEAVRRSSGFSGVEEAGEVYFYRQLGGLSARRLSGGFGNQVAHQGLERVSHRAADRSILSRGFAVIAQRPRGGAELRSASERLLQEDGTLPSVGNALIGQSFATQQMPYASRGLIESLGRSPLAPEPSEEFSVVRARWRDLRHRLVGEPVEQSFQRALIVGVGGPVASFPVNWGWRPSGGVSVSGRVMGALACLDQVASWTGPGSRGLRSILRMSGLEGLHEIKPYRAWVTERLRDFTYDTLLANATRCCGLFDNRQLARVLREHYELGRDRTNTIIAALDLALAREVFSVSN